MCVLCLFMWALTISGEINSLFHFARAVIALPRAATTRLHLADDTAHFECVSGGRCLCVVIVQLCRLVLASLLLVSGALWLSYETDVGNLLLNAVALEFVLK